MDENELTNRLRALADETVPDAVRVAHLQRMAATPADPTHGFGRAWVAAAAIVGFLAGSTGLAAAGALPDPAQDVAHDVLAVVQVDVPEGKRGPCVSAIAKSDLSQAEKKSAKDDCPKGGNGASGGDGAGKSDEAPGSTKHADDPCKGKPPWAGKKDLTTEQKDALKAERAATCGTEREADDADELEGDDDGVGTEDGGESESTDTTEADG